MTKSLQRHLEEVPSCRVVRCSKTGLVKLCVDAPAAPATSESLPDAPKDDDESFLEASYLYKFVFGQVIKPSLGMHSQSLLRPCSPRFPLLGQLSLDGLNIHRTYVATTDQRVGVGCSG